MSFRTLVYAAVFAALPVAGSAATLYDPGPLTFQTQERQSTWGPGPAAEISDTIFAGAQWNESFSTGAIVGEVSTTTIKDITFSTRLAAWNACRDSIFSGLCGPRPTDGSFTITTDTRTGAKVDVSTSGKAGFDLNYKLSAGSLGASFDYNVEAFLPHARDIRAGEDFHIQTSSVFSDGALDTQSPTAEASVDAVLKIDASVSGQGCVLLVGCASGSGKILDVDEDRELIGVDLNQITYLDGFTPDWAELSTSIANQSVGLQVGVVNGVPTVVVDAPFLPKPPGLGATLDLGEIEFTAPIFTAEGEKAGGSLKAMGRSDFIDVTADLDTLFGLAGGANASFGPIGVSVDAYDFDAGPSLDVFQDLTITPELMVKLDFSAPVEIAGSLRNSFEGAWNALPKFRIFEETTFTPTFFVKAMVESVTGLQVGLELTMEFLKGAVSLSAFDFTLLSASLGPLFSETFAFDPDWGKFSLFDEIFHLQGLTEQQAAAFTLRPYEDVQVIPLPAGAVLMLTALAGLGLARRRQRRAGSGRMPMPA